MNRSADPRRMGGRLAGPAWNSPLSLLLVTGALFGLTLPFGKMAATAGVAPLAWAALVSLGAGGLLLAGLVATGRVVRPNGHKLRYFLIAGTLSYAVPNILLFSAIPHLGAGYAGIMFTLSPVITLVLSILLRVRKPNLLGIAGIAVGFAGALLVATTRGEAGRPAELVWIFVGLAIPALVAAGNIYRTWDWPKDGGPIELAVGSHLAAAALVLAAMALTGTLGSLAAIGVVPGLALAQALSSAAMFAFFFRLQEVGGPVYLSQIGYVGAAVALFSGTLFLGESYSLATWAGAAIIVVGVVLTTKAQSGGR